MKRCAFCGPIEPNLDDLQSRSFDYLIAIDGGFAFLEQAGLEPDVALGDFDSLGYVPEDTPTFTYPAHKDKTDTELALEWAAALDYDELWVYGVLGARMDHTVANLQLLAKFAHMGQTVFLIDADTCVCAITGETNGCITFGWQEHGTVSVFAVDEFVEGVTEVGFVYPLEQATLMNSEPLGISNEFDGKPASISVESGTVWVFFPLSCIDSVRIGKDAFSR